MSIAAENAGLGPCELPLSDQWLSHAQFSQTSPHLSHLSASTGNSFLSHHHLHHHQQQQQQHQHHSSLQQQHPPHQSQTTQSQAKIMNAVASAVACPPAVPSSKKIRRKSDNKVSPQSQLNKCNNEKRRREQENEYIEQLGEFLQINKRDMTATKPDKAAILNEVVNTYRQILQKGGNRSDHHISTAARCTKCPPNCADSCTVHPVQQGDVSSTEPPLPDAALVNGKNPEIYAYFEAVEHYFSAAGWTLLQINSDGIIETVTENIKDLICFTRAELQKQSIYSYLFTGDHAKLSPILNNMSFDLGWDQDDGQNISKRPIKTRIRMLVKHPEGTGETMEQIQQRPEIYEELVLCATPFNKDSTDDSSPVLCILTRPEDDIPIESNMHQRSLEQLTLKLDTSGRIININTAALRATFAAQITKESGRPVQELCHIQDLAKLQAHLKEVMQSSTAQSAPYRLRIGSTDLYIHVKAHSRLFRNSSSGECDFIMSVMTVLSDNEVATLESQHGTNVVSMVASTSHSSQHSGSMGGPLMTSAINGGSSGGSSTMSLVQHTTARVGNSNNNNVVTSFSSPPTTDSSAIFSSESFDFTFHSDSFEINGMESVGVNWDSRPDSRTSVTPVSTPRPPSVSAFSPAASICQSPLTSYHSSAGQPSPSSNNNNNNNNNIINNNNNNINNNNNSGSYGGYTFSGFDDKDTKEHVQQQSQSILQQQQQQHQQQQTNHDSERLRNLLTKRPHSNTSSSGPDSEHEQRNANKILKGLLNAEEDKDNSNYNKFNPTLTARLNQPKSRHTDNKTGGNNTLLCQLLNDKSDEDDGSDSRTSANRSSGQSELLRQLQKDDPPKEHSNMNSQMGDEALMQLLRIQGNDYSNRKRSLNEADDGSTEKRPENKPSKLREKNKMLASLLSNPSKAPATYPPPIVKTIPDIPQSRISSTGQQIHSPAQQQQQHQQQQLQQQSTTQTHNQKITGIQQQLSQVTRPTMQVRKPSDVYLNQQQQQHHIPTQQDLNKNQQMLHSNTTRPQGFQMDSGIFATSTAATPTQPQLEFDSELSDILNTVIDIVPDFNNGLNMLGGIMPEQSVTPTQPQQQQDINEKMAINAITKSLMQFESTVGYNASPPAYSMHSGGVTSQSNQQSGFAPPPIYTQRPIRMPQVQNNSAIRPQYQQMQRERMLQQQQKERLLQQQQKQSMVVPSNATAGADQLCISNYDSLLNNVPPNVSLQRSTNVVADSQLSPSYTQNMLQQQLSPNQRTQFSPQPNAGYQQFSNNGQRLSPQQQQQLNQQQQQQQQQQMAFQATGTNVNSNNNNNSQLSPRQLPPFSQQNTQSAANSSQPLTTQSQWNTSPNPRLSIQQQQNPMLNAQLQQITPNVATPNYQTQRQYQQAAQRQRTLNSPSGGGVVSVGGAANRQHSFAGQETSSGFPGPPSPTTGGGGPNYANNIFNNPQMRLQRQTSIPQGTQHLPGSPRPFGGPGSDSATSYGMMYSNISNMPHSTGTTGDYYSRATTGGNTTNSMKSEFVRQELRAVVSGRTQQPSGGGSGNNTASGGIRPSQSPLGNGGGGAVNATGSNNNTNNSNNGGIGGSGGGGGGGNSGGGNGLVQSGNQTQMAMVNQQQQQQLPGTPSLLSSPPDPTLGFNFDMTQTADYFGGNSNR